MHFQSKTLLCIQGLMEDLAEDSSYMHQYYHKVLYAG